MLRGCPVLCCAARELVREVDYTLKTLAKNLLGQDRSEVPSTGTDGCAWGSLHHKAMVGITVPDAPDACSVPVISVVCHALSAVPGHACAAEVPGRYENAAGLRQLLLCGESDAWLALGLAMQLSGGWG